MLRCHPPDESCKLVAGQLAGWLAPRTLQEEALALGRKEADGEGRGSGLDYSLRDGGQTPQLGVR